MELVLLSEVSVALLPLRRNASRSRSRSCECSLEEEEEAGYEDEELGDEEDSECAGRLKSIAAEATATA
jgi:hypothetical protein